MRRIIVIGGSGLFGRPVVESLKKQGIKPLVLTHNPRKAEKNLDQETDIIEADVTKPDTLHGVFQSVDALHISLNTLLQNEIYNVVANGVKNIIDEAKKSDISLITYTSQANVSLKNKWFPLINARMDAEKHIMDSGIPYIIYRPVHFMESLKFFTMGNQVTQIKDYNTSAHWLSCLEFADLVSDQHINAPHKNQIIYLKGPEYFSLSKALVGYKNEIIENGRFNPLTIDMLRSIAQFSNNPEMIFVASYLDFIGCSQEMPGYNPENHLLLEGKITFQEWLIQQKTSVKL